jgi:hypothetical protein
MGIARVTDIRPKSKRRLAKPDLCCAGRPDHDRFSENPPLPKALLGTGENRRRNAT